MRLRTAFILTLLATAVYATVYCIYGATPITHMLAGCLTGVWLFFISKLRADCGD